MADTNIIPSSYTCQSKPEIPGCTASGPNLLYTQDAFLAILTHNSLQDMLEWLRRMQESTKMIKHFYILIQHCGPATYIKLWDVGVGGRRVGSRNKRIIVFKTLSTQIISVSCIRWRVTSYLITLAVCQPCVCWPHFFLNISNHSSVHACLYCCRLCAWGGVSVFMQVYWSLSCEHVDPPQSPQQ